MMFDAALLSRIQFAFTIGFHILFPVFNIGLALFLAITEGCWLKTKNEKYLIITKFWSKIFALTFGLGVVSGIVLSYELGTNFGPYMHRAGGVVGALFIYEVLAAFFLEAGFLGIMLFGWDKVTPKLHYMATLMVAIGTVISALAIMAANSWMQTPAGFHELNGQYVVDSWVAVIFNPSYVGHALHMLVASYLTTTFVIAGISAWYLLKGRFIAISQSCFQFALVAGFVLSVLQIFLGDHVGLKVYRYQPLKTAAIEAIWETQEGAPFLLFAIPDSRLEKNHYEIGIPKIASLLNTHRWNGKLIGLKTVPPEDRPPVGIVFWSFRIMVAIGFLFLGVSTYALYLRLRKRLFQQRWFYKVCVLIAPFGFVGTIAGWFVTESGRQPWVVYGFMRTSESISPLPGCPVLISLSSFVLIYSVVFAFYLYYLAKVIRKGPEVATTSKDSMEVISPFKYLAPEEQGEGGELKR